ncbi:MAG: hypothetical protein ABEK59_10155 [Halobacteria archaeon]
MAGLDSVTIPENYWQAQNLYASKRKSARDKPLGYATRLEKQSDRAYLVRYHGNPIILYEPQTVSYYSTEYADYPSTKVRLEESGLILYKKRLHNCSPLVEVTLSMHPNYEKQPIDRNQFKVFEDGVTFGQPGSRLVLPEEGRQALRQLLLKRWLATPAQMKRFQGRFTELFLDRTVHLVLRRHRRAVEWVGMFSGGSLLRTPIEYRRELEQLLEQYDAYIDGVSCYTVEDLSFQLSAKDIMSWFYGYELANV